MKIPLKYSYRNLLARRLTTMLTVFGITLVVFVFAGVLMLSNGLKNVFAASGSPENVIVLRESSASEIMSFITREQYDIIRTSPEIALDSYGDQLVEGELIVMINLPRRVDGQPANIMVRGVGPKSAFIHKGFKLIDGRMFDMGKTEIVAGKKAAAQFEGCALGETVSFGTTDWTVVGVFEAGESSLESEVWGDAEQFLPAFGRPVFSTVIFRLSDPTAFDKIRERIKSDPRMTVELKREDKYYADQTHASAVFINSIGTTLSIVFSLGAIIGAMITMYAAVSNRTTEIATMRALGFRRRNILIAFLIESILISVTGGILGLIGASFLQLASVPLLNFDTFTEVSFNFTLSPMILISSMAFSVIMGLLGGFLPAARAARIKMVDALKAE